MKTKMGQQGEIGSEIELNAVYNGSPENEEFFRYTPQGKVTLGIVREEAATQFEIGKEYYADFSPAN